MKHIISVLALGAMVLTAQAQTADWNQVVPLPQGGAYTVKAKVQPFVLKQGSKVYYAEGNAKMARNAQFLVDYLREVSGISLGVTTDAKAKDIAIRLVRTPEGKSAPEGYTLDVDAKRGITISGDEAGVFYGIQTLRKAMPVQGTEELTVVDGQAVPAVSVPAVGITDAPRFAYRGAMLDVCRHYFPMEFVKKYLDILALHGINRLHWHITEDQGWRIEIKKYPELIAVGSRRAETVIGHNSGWYDGMPYGGYYTQDQARELVAYAAERYIEIIPEVDLPGHMVAALATYPDLGCTGGPYRVMQEWGVADDVLCVGNPRTMQFLHDVLGELAEVFPSKYFHIGGDECPRVRWKTCPKCQAKAKELGLKAQEGRSVEAQLQSYVMNDAQKFLASKGKIVIGWDEILEGGVNKEAVVMSWRGEDGGIAAARLGHDVIMTPNTYLYFDYLQSQDARREPQGIGGFLPVEKVYSYEPLPESLTPEEQKHILGAQCNLWTEYIPTARQAEYMLLPRLAALSEVQWRTPQERDFEKFVDRMGHLRKLYDLLGYTYAKHIFQSK